MDQFGMFAKDFGIRPQGKSAPMKPTGSDRRSRPASSSSTFAPVNNGNDMFNDVFGGPPKYTNSYNSIFKDSVSPNFNNETKTKPNSSNSPVYDKPRYDDDVFDKQSQRRYEDDVFASMTASPPKRNQQSHRSKHSDEFDDLFGNLGRTEKAEPMRHRSDKSSRGLDDLIPGFGSNSPASSSRWSSEPSPKSTRKTKQKSNAMDDPFVVLESTPTPVTPSHDMFGDTNRKKVQSRNHSEDGSSVGSARSSLSREPLDEHTFVYSEHQHFQESHQTVHGMKTVPTKPPSSEDDIWLTVSEIPLFTPVTRAPPPSRPPPPIPARASTTRKFDNDFSSRSKEPVQVAMDEEKTEREQEEKIREIEREKARQAVERANREARERAVTEARVKAERAAVQRAQSEARERAAVEARERAERAAVEKAAAEVKEKETREKEKVAVAKAQAEARRRAERAAVDRVTAQARDRAAAEARERAAAAAKMNQQRNDNEFGSFFSTGAQQSGEQKGRVNSNDSATDPLSKQGPEATHRASSSGVPSNARKASFTTNYVDDLNSSIFGGGMPAGEFHDVEGETEDRRRARLDRQQRTQERAAKALAEKNQRDLQIQKEQEERHRISATLDVEIKRWAAGKEGNLRAMLSTLQYVLWPECGWQPVSLTDLITGASVKKVYRKATLCIHPDKVQQKGANLQQKYVAEKEAWNKFNSEELF